jgi:colanic acid/amylovoran biosynthesis glycosyltransferase
VWRERYTELFDAGRLFLAEGPAMAERLEELGCPGEKVAIQRVAIDLDRYRFRPPQPHDGPTRLLFCGRFVEKKGLEYAIEAVHRLRGRHAIELHLVGDGKLRPAVEATIDRLGLRSHVVLHGMVDHDALIRMLGEADLLVQPSVVAADGDTEGGAPTTLLEAQATGLPIVATRHQDIPYVVAGDAAVLVAERDADALADAIDGLIRSPDRWPAMGEAGRRFVEERHGIGSLIDELEARYLRLADEAV